MNGHKLVIHAEMDGGKDISEKEIRLIMDDLERRGFHSHYYRSTVKEKLRIPMSRLVQKLYEAVE